MGDMILSKGLHGGYREVHSDMGVYGNRAPSTGFLGL